MKYFSSSGDEIRLGDLLGRGGEGAVYAVDGISDSVAKIYHEPIDEEKAAKLIWMAAHKSEALLKIAAWLTDTLHDAPGGKVVGFLMPGVHAKEIHDLYALKSRRVHFPKATWRFLIHTASNVARAFYTLHHHDHIMGDVNHGNCVVLRDGTVRLIDCDSYSISRGDLRERCGVGVATHLAPELHGRDLSSVERTFDHDNFGLAVIIFQLLFLGRHPFAGVLLGEADKSLEECIREFRYAYAQDADARGIKPPPGTLPISAITPRVAELFEQAFLSLSRPTPREWIEALVELSESLKTCATHSGHFYYDAVSQCPWCELETQTGVALFPFVRRTDGSGLDVVTINKLLDQFSQTSLVPALTEPVLATVAPDPLVVEINHRTLVRGAMVAAAQVGIVIYVLLFFRFTFPSLIFSLLSIPIALIFVHLPRRYEVNLIKSEFDEASRAWEQLRENLENSPLIPQVREDIEELRGKLTAYRELAHPDNETSEPANSLPPVALKSTARKRVLEADIERLFSNLRASSNMIARQRLQIESEIKKLEETLTKKGSNRKAVSSLQPYALTYLGIAVLTPMMMSFFLPFGPGTDVTVKPPPMVKRNDLYRGPEDPQPEEIARMSEQEKKAGLVHFWELARSHRVANNPIQAEMHYLIALRFDPRASDINLELGRLYFDRKRFAEALKHLVNSNDNSAYILFKKGKASNELAYHGDALRYFKRAEEAGYRSSDLYFEQGMAYKELGMNQDAALSFSKALDLASGDNVCRYNYAIVLSKVGNKTEVRNQYYELTLRDPELAKRLKDELSLED